MVVYTNNHGMQKYRRLCLVKIGGKMEEKDFMEEKDEISADIEEKQNSPKKRGRKRNVSVDEYRYMEKITLPQEGNIEDFIDLRRYKVGIKKYDLLLDDYRNTDRFLLQPFFQRRYVWDDLRKSRLIESIIMGIPIPTIYTYTRQDSNEIKEIVIDGQQRLKTIKLFVKNQFPLDGLKLNAYLNGLRFYELPNNVKVRFLNYTLHIVNITNVADDKIVLDMFKRFNTGGVALTPQELRNCYCSGQFNEAIKKLSGYEAFKELFMFEEDRMQKEEYIVRFLALYEDLTSYTYDAQQLLDNYYCKKLKLQETNPEELTSNINNLTRIFMKTVDACIIVFGKNSFKNFITFKSNDTKVKGFYRRFARAVFDMQMLGFADIDLELIIRHRDKIKASFENMMAYSSEIKQNLSHSSKLKTLQRIDTWKKLVLEVIDD